MDDRPELDPALMLIRLGPVLHRHQVVLAGSLGTDVAGVVVLELTDRLGPMGVGVLADRIGLSSSATSRLVDRLERGGLADRTPDRDVDGRRMLVGPTARASAVLRRAHTELAEWITMTAPLVGEHEDAVVRWLLDAGDAVVRHDREAVSARRFRAWVASTDTP